MSIHIGYAGTTEHESIGIKQAKALIYSCSTSR